jgi:hypothetical protein
MRNKLILMLAALATAASAAPALAQDLYIGTVDIQKDQVILTRCDLTENRYVLRDRKGEPETPVAKLRARLKTLKAPVYVEVFGEYAEVPSEDGNGLDVISLENITAAKSCHLTDVLPGG